MSVSPSRIRIRRAVAVAALVLLVAAAWGFLRLGVFFNREDPLQKADAMLVLAGTRVERTMEAADLYRDGWAPIIVLSDWLPERGIAILRARGVDYEPDILRQQSVLRQLGVPAAAIVVPSVMHDNTAQEAQTLRRLAQLRGWRRVIVVSSKYHLRRAGYAFRRELAGSGVEVTMHGSRYDPATPARWWTRRGDLRDILSEGPKFVAYLLGLGA